FQIVLDSQPTADVTIVLQSSDPEIVTLSTVNLTFTPGDWNTAQTITVTATGLGGNGSEARFNITATASSSDTTYDGQSTRDLTVVYRPSSVSSTNENPTTNPPPIQVGVPDPPVIDVFEGNSGGTVDNGNSEPTPLPPEFVDTGAGAANSTQGVGGG